MLHKTFQKQQTIKTLFCTVEKAEGFYSLERKFGLSEAEIIKLNPEVKNGLKSDSQIWIPKENFERYKYGSTPLSSGNQIFENSNQKILSASSPENVKEISFVLPFRVSGIAEADKMTTLKSRLNDNKVTPITTDFYSGALIALDSLQKMGYNMPVN